MNPLWDTVLVASGGALGATARYWAGVAAVGLFGGSLPIGTFFVNIVGGFLIGILGGADWTGHHGRVLLISGVLGGFTTFSAFSLETVRLVEGGRPVLAFGYVIGSVILSISAAAAGVMVARASA